MSTEYDPIKLEIFKHLFAAVAEEMGIVLRKSSYSPNISPGLPGEGPGRQPGNHEQRVHRWPGSPRSNGK